MVATVWYFPECPNWRVGKQRLRRALDRVGCADAEVRLESVSTAAEAAAAGFAGSPTFTVDGADLFDPPPATGVLACRVYQTADGVAGVPGVEDLVAVLARKVTS